MISLHCGHSFVMGAFSAGFGMKALPIMYTTKAMMTKSTAAPMRCP